jgi:hypothetical protein
MKNGKSEPLGKAARQGQLWLHLPGLVGEALYETVIAAGLACVDDARPTRAIQTGRGAGQFFTSDRRSVNGRCAYSTASAASIPTSLIAGAAQNARGQTRAE